MLATQLFAALMFFFFPTLCFIRAHLINDIQSFWMVHRKCIAAAIAAVRQGRESVQVFPVFRPRCCLVPTHQLPRPSLRDLEIHNRLSIRVCISPLVFQCPDNVLLLSVRVLSQQHLIKRHVMVRRNQSWKTRRGTTQLPHLDVEACADVCACVLSAQQNSRILHLQVKMEADLFAH